MASPTIRKVLIANRGEIALRILRACRDLQIPAVIAYSDADRNSLPVRLADEAVCIGPAAVSRSYTNIPAIISAALVTGCDALHPGYGFLSENAYLAEICSEVGITFIGPPASVISKMGNKAEARQVMKDAGVPLMPGSDGIVRTLAEAKSAARKVGYPVLIKAAAGGGGRGMRVATTEAELTRQLPVAQSEAESAFGNGDVYIEHYLENPRHVEVQILADNHGHVYAIGDRDCSLQRRHQKIIEEAPAPFLTKRVRDNIMKAAAKGARAAGYRSAGTLEFLVDKEGHFYFMEMNTRIQVEHPVTELVSNIDLVAWQIRIARGEQLRLEDKDLEPRGHAIECRITCEDPFHNFAASIGTVQNWIAPGGPGMRVDSHLYSGYEIPPFYDSLLAKVVAWGKDRNEAIDRMQRALRETIVDGVSTITPLHSMIMADPGFRAGNLHTGFVGEFMSANEELLAAEESDVFAG